MTNRTRKKGRKSGRVEEEAREKNLRRLPNPLVERYSSVSRGVKSPPAKGCGARPRSEEAFLGEEPAHKRETTTTSEFRPEVSCICSVEIQREQETLERTERKGYASGRGQRASGEPRRH